MKPAARLDTDIVRMLRRGLSLRNENGLYDSIGMLTHQTSQMIRRRLKGVTVPAALMVSVTSRCNLRCRDCYHRAKDIQGDEMSDSELHDLVRGFRKMGTSIFVFAGGEPLTRWNTLRDIIYEDAKSIYLIFTNGTMIDDRISKEMGSLHNLLTVVSMETDAESMEEVRGRGTASKVSDSISRLRREGCFFGISVILRHDNVHDALDVSFVDSMHECGSRFISYVEYVPMKEGTEVLCLEEDDRTYARNRLKELQKDPRMVTLSFPGDEDRYQGCLAAGRGFLHISSSGDLEACPAAPFSDANIRDGDVDLILSSPYMSRLREMHEQLREDRGGCTLWANREEVRRELHAIDSRHGSAGADGVPLVAIDTAGRRMR